MRDATRLEGSELATLLRRVFAPEADERRLAILVDLPDDELADTPDWSARRAMAASWARELADVRGDEGFERITLALYRNVRANNADLPETLQVYEIGGALPGHAEPRPLR